MITSIRAAREELGDEELSETMVPILLLIPMIVSGLHLVVEMVSGELSRTHLTILAAWFLAAGYLQFRGSSAVLSVIGLVAQVVLAIYFRLRVTLERSS